MNGFAEPEPSAEPGGLIHLEGDATGGRLLVLCDHASNRVPAGYGSLGLPDAEMQRHIAWDPGALPVARDMARRLGSPLIYPDASRLLIDCNRPTDAPDSATTHSEETEIPGNVNLDPGLRAHRIADIYKAYHDAIDAILDQRAAAGIDTALVAVHSFTPIYRGKPRPWHVGVLYDSDRRLADRLFLLLNADAELVVGENEPYGPWDGVYHTLSRHGEARGLACVMIEIRNDLIGGTDGQVIWADRLATALSAGVRAI